MLYGKCCYFFNLVHRTKFSRITGSPMRVIRNSLSESVINIRTHIIQLWFADSTTRTVKQQ